MATVVGLSKDPNGNSLEDDYVGAIVSPIIGKPFEKMKYGGIVGGFLGEYGGDVNKLEEGFNNFQKFIKDKYENK